MKQRFVFFLLFPLILLACATLVPARPDDDRPTSTVFDNLVCHPPCWNNIVPGITTERQAQEILTTLANQKNGKVSEQKYSDGRMYLSYFTHNEYVHIMILNNNVKWIQFQGFMPLKYVLESLGEPEYAVKEMYGEIGWMTILYYPERGIEIWCMPRSFLVIGSIGCNLESDVQVYFHSPEDYETQLVGKYGSPENAQYAQSFFCPWVGVEAQYLSVDWGPINNPDEYPTLSPAEVKSQCPTGK